MKKVFIASFVVIASLVPSQVRAFDVVQEKMTFKDCKTVVYMHSLMENEEPEIKTRGDDYQEASFYGRRNPFKITCDGNRNTMTIFDL